MHIIVMPPHIIMQGIPLIIMRAMASQRSLNISPDIPSMGMHFIVMPSLVMSMLIRHIMGIIGIMPICGIMLIMGIIGIMPIWGIMPGCGIMPGIMPMPIMLGMLGIIIAFIGIGWLIGIEGIIMAPGPPVKLLAPGRMPSHRPSASHGSATSALSSNDADDRLR
jgi:hypothetical protein